MQHHLPVMKEAFLSFFREKHIRYFVDATLGAGGHSLALLEEHPEIQRLIGIDQDPKALEIASDVLKPFASKVLLLQSNFSRLDHLMQVHNIPLVDGIFLDLGVSSMQLDTANRGFSFQKEAPLDMRMSPETTLTASDIVNSWNEEELANVLYEYGEERRSRKIAHSILLQRRKKKIETTIELANIIQACVPRSSGCHPATKSFQALRLAVNSELEVLTRVIPQAIDHLNPNGRFGIITFHSLEDRIVKFAFRDLKASKMVDILTKKPLVPTRAEMSYNKRSRSAKLRFVEKSSG